MIPKCIKFDNPCLTHKDGKYKKWKCGEVYSSLERSNLYQKSKIPCLDLECKNLIIKTSKYCKNCYYKYNSHPSKGKKLSKKWCDNIRKGQEQTKSHMWKGEQAGYSSIHRWLRKYYGSPKKCDWCGLKGSRPKRNWTIQWANIDGSYRRDIKNWICLCAKCHAKQEKGLKHIPKRIHWKS